jgi:hypothetical protein
MIVTTCGAAGGFGTFGGAGAGVCALAAPAKDRATTNNATRYIVLEIIGVLPGRRVVTGFTRFVQDLHVHLE